MLRKRYKEATKKQEAIDILHNETQEIKSSQAQKPPHKSSGKYLIKSMAKPTEKP